MHLPDCDPAEEILRNLVHDLRQPLGTIEISAYVLNRSLNETDGPVRDHIRVVERQLEQASRVLLQAVAEMRRVKAHREAAENCDLTKSVTAALT